MIILAWFYYSSWYILLGVLVTLGINHLTKRLYLAPLFINAIAALLLFGVARMELVSREAATYAMYFNYVPVVLTSVITNGIIFIRRRIKQKQEGLL